MKKILLKDIAEKVGVSTSLVSYVLNDQAVEKKVKHKTAEKIREAAIELNYRPNQIAKSLKTNKTLTIGLVVADINYRFSTGITHSIESEAQKNNYTVIFGNSEEKNKKFSGLVSVLVDRQVDGLILVPVENCESEIKYLQKIGKPFVLIDRYFEDITTNVIALDNYRAAFDLTEYLIKTGHRRIGFVNYKSSLLHLLKRNEGYFDALQKHGVKTDRNFFWEVETETLLEDIKKGISRLTKVDLRCDAIFFATDILTINGLKCLNQLKLKVPEDLSVMSFDEAEAFELFYCDITHGKQPLKEMGKLAVDTLIEIIGNNNFQNKYYLKLEIVVGKSCRE